MPSRLSMTSNEVHWYSYESTRAPCNPRRQFTMLIGIARKFINIRYKVFPMISPLTVSDRG